MKTRGIPAAALAFAFLSLMCVLATARAGDPAPSRKSAPRPAADELAAHLGHLTLDDAIDIALHRNPDILRQLQEIQRQQGVFIQVRGTALPQVIASGTFQQTDRNLLESQNSSGGSGQGFNLPQFRTLDPNTGQKSFTDLNPFFNSLFGFGGSSGSSGAATGFGSSGSGLGSGSTTADKTYTVQVEVQQQIYNAAIPPSIRQAKFLRDSAYYTLRETVDTTINNVKTGFYGVLLDKAQIEIANESLRLLQSQLTDQQNRFAAGTVPRFDVLQASVAVANQRPQVITATNTLNLAFITLSRSLGLEYGPEQAKNSPIQLVGNLDYHPQNFSPEEGVNAGKANRALLKAQRLVILSNVEQIRIAAAGYQPAITASAGYELTSDRISDDLGRSLHGWFFGGQFNWNIFDGLQTYGRVKQAQAGLRESRIAYLDDVNQVVQDIQNNYLTLQQSKELIASQVLNVSEAEEAVRLSQARLSAGAGTQLDVLQSQTQLLTAQTTELQARYNYAVALSNYERVTATSTIYDEAFYDPLTNRHVPFGRDESGTAPTGKALPMGAVKTPDVQTRGTGQPLPKKINAENPNREARPAKPLTKRDYLFEE